MKKVNDWYSASAILSDVFVIVCSVALVEVSGKWWLYPIAAFIIGTRQNSLRDILGHEAAHYNLFRNKNLNRLSEIVCFLPLFETFDRYRKEHMTHHKGVMGLNDPARICYERWGLYNSEVNWLFVWFVRPFLLWDALYYLKFIGSTMAENSSYRNRLLIFWLTTLALAIAGGWLLELILYWLIPFFWIKPAVEFWNEVSDHFKVETGDTRVSLGWFHDYILRPHNDGYHTVHHRYPKMAWHELKQYFDHMDKEEKLERTSGFMETYAIIRSR